MEDSFFFLIKPIKCTNFTNLFWHATCRVSCQNKFVKLVHLIGFIKNKFVTMHGHMNVKYGRFTLHPSSHLKKNKWTQK